MIYQDYSVNKEDIFFMVSTPFKRESDLVNLFLSLKKELLEFNIVNVSFSIVDNGYCISISIENTQPVVDIYFFNTISDDCFKGKGYWSGLSNFSTGYIHSYVSILYILYFLDNYQPSNSMSVSYFDIYSIIFINSIFNLKNRVYFSRKLKYLLLDTDSTLDHYHYPFFNIYYMYWYLRFNLNKKSLVDSIYK